MGVSQQQQMQQCSQDTALNGMPDTNEQQQQLNVQQQQPAPDNERCALQTQLKLLPASKLQLQMCSRHTAVSLAALSNCVLGHAC
jgi:hypothetical protein